MACVESTYYNFIWAIAFGVQGRISNGGILGDNKFNKMKNKNSILKGLGIKILIKCIFRV